MSDATSSRQFVVDASVWVARYLPDDRFHRPSRDWLNALLPGENQLVGPILVLGEVGGAVTRRSGDPALGHDAIAELERLPVLTLIDIDSVLGRAAARLAIDFRLRGADAVYAALAPRLALPLITWDRELIDRTVDQIDARTPSDHPSP